MTRRKRSRRRRKEKRNSENRYARHTGRNQPLEKAAMQLARARVYPEQMPMILLSQPASAIFDRRLFSRGTRHAVSPRFQCEFAPDGQRNAVVLRIFVGKRGGREAGSPESETRARPSNSSSYIRLGSEPNSTAKISDRTNEGDDSVLEWSRLDQGSH